MCHKFMAHSLFSFLRSFFIGFHGWIGGILAYRITHGFSRIFGLWPMAGARNIPLLFFVTQISQMTQIFLRGSFLSHRFRRWRRFFFVEVFCPTDFTDDADFSSWKFFVSQISQIFLRGIFPILRGICNDRIGRLRVNPWVIALAGNLRINSVSSDE